MKTDGMIVAIDGPAGAGKSSVARALAEVLGYAFLDTGAMYRCVTLACLRSGVSLDDQEKSLQIANDCHIELNGEKVLLNGEDVSAVIRQPEVSQAIKPIASHPGIRALMVERQRRICERGDYVTEGRDQGTVAFPQAECKIFLTASPQERAKRRVEQLHRSGVAADYESILSQQNERDANDANRATGPLRAASDAILVHTDGMTEDQVLAQLLEIVRSKRRLPP
jgi:cytidylate kinase